MNILLPLVKLQNFKFILALSILFAPTLLLQAQEKGLTVNGVKLTISENETLYVNGSVIVGQTISGGNIDNGDILNSGKIYITDSIFNFCPTLFTETSNPRLANSDPGISKGMFFFVGSSTQTIGGSIGRNITFNKIIINNPLGVILKNSIVALDSVNLISGNIFLNGNDLFLYCDFTHEEKYDGRIGLETSDSKIYDDTKLDYNPFNNRTGHVISKFQNTEEFKKSNIGISTIEATFRGKFEIQRGHASLPYAGDGSVRKYFLLKTEKNIDSPQDFIITYLDDSDYKNLNINEPDFKIFLNEGVSSPSYSPVSNSTVNTITNKAAGYTQVSSTKQTLITIADSICADPPTAILNKNIEVCAGIPFDITINSTSAPKSERVYHQWNWIKNGVTHTSDSDRTNIRDTLNNPGSVKYALKVYDNRGCFSRDTVTVTCYPIPQAKISENEPNYCYGESVELKDESTITGDYTLSRVWSLGDNTTSNLETLTHIYSEPRSYEIQLVSSANGCSSTATKTINVHPLPTVEFTAEKICDKELLLARVSNTTTTSPDEKISEVNWDFGDGTSSTEINPELHQYTSEGEKEISLWVKTQHGCEDTHSSVLTINSHTINFSAENVCLGSETIFNNLSTINDQSATTSAVAHTFTWDFGDGTTSTDAKPMHAYTSAGTYEVSLYMHIDNCTYTLTKEIIVHAKPEASFTAENTCSGSRITLTPKNFNYSNYSWNIEGNEISDISPNYTFNTAGNSTVTLTVTNISNCTSTSTQTIRVYPKPVANFSIQSSCEGNPTMFFNQSIISGATLSYQWTFNEFNTSTKINPEFDFTASSNTNTATLIATSNNGCTDTITKPVEVYPVPSIGLSSGITSFCGNTAEVDATDKNLPGCRYIWSDGVKTPSRTFINEGVYSVTATSSHGCESSKEIEIKLNTAMDPIPQTSISFCGSGKLSTGYSDSWCTWEKPSGEIVTGVREIDVNESGLYKIIVTGGGCSVTDNVNVTVNPLPIVSLGTDFSICQGTTTTLNAGLGFSSYSWSTGETTSFISVKQGGKYRVIVTNSSGCTNADTIAVKINPVPAKPFTVNEIAQCKFADLSAGHSAVSYLWSTGESTNSIRVYNSGDYWVKVSNAECSTYDTLKVTINQIDALNLGPDISVCEGNQAVISAGYHGAEYSYLWNKQPSTSNSLSTYKAGRYICEIINNTNGCSATDTVFINLNPKPRINLGTDKALCNAAFVTLDAGNEGSMIQWGASNNFVSIQQKVNLTEAGKYWVTIMNEWGCVASDTIQIHPSSGNVVALFIAASKIYEGDTVVFKNMSYPMPYSSEWTFDDGIKSILENPYHIYYYPKTFNATLTVTNGYCTSTITKPITVIQDTRGTGSDGSKKRGKYIEIISSKVYPNPTSGNITFELEINDFTDVIVGIYSITGRLVTMEKFSKSLILNKQYNLNNVTPGIYILKAWIGTESVAYKIIKTK